MVAERLNVIGHVQTGKTVSLLAEQLNTIGFYGSNQSHLTATSRLAVSSGLNIAIDWIHK